MLCIYSRENVQFSTKSYYLNENVMKTFYIPIFNFLLP